MNEAGALNLDWFNRYKFRQPLGQGGMGTVYLAEDKVEGNRQCVIKQLTNKYTDPGVHQEAIRLFRREVAILRNLDHPGIVRVSDEHVTDDGRYFLVMDLVPGNNLEVMLKTGGPFESNHVAWIAIQCAEILEYLHSQVPPIIYRDLKPSNLMLTPDGKVVFVDFGIARTFMPKEAATRVVTAGYSPPEQYLGKPEVRSDLYSLGQTMGHLLTGMRPKPLSSYAPLHLNQKVHRSLDAIVRQLTSYEPNMRPESATAVKYDLHHIYKEMHPGHVIPKVEFFAPMDNSALAKATSGSETSLTDLNDPTKPKIWKKILGWLGI